MPQALIVAPTRELAVQIKESIVALARSLDIRVEAIYGGVSMDDQTYAIKRGCQVVVGTPGRLNDHIRRKTLSLEPCRRLYLMKQILCLIWGLKKRLMRYSDLYPKSEKFGSFRQL